MPKVGLFFWVKNNLLADMIKIDHAELYGDFKIGKSSHYGIWSERYEKLYNKPYDYYPRGRVVYNYKEDKYILYADKCIDEYGIKEVLKTFGIENYNVKIDRTDSHYVCKKCNKYYLE